MNSAPYTSYPPPRSRRRSGGCFVRGLLVLVVLLLVVVASWFFAIRPYVHNIAQTQLDNALTDGINQLDTIPELKQIPANTVIPVQENIIKNGIALNLAPADPIKNPDARITPDSIRLSFTAYGYPCAVSFMPQVEQGKLVARNVSIEGALGLIMSPDEMSNTLNKHFADALQKLQRNVNNVQLKDHELDLTLA